MRENDFRVKLEDKKTGKSWTSGRNWDDVLLDIKNLQSARNHIYDRINRIETNVSFLFREKAVQKLKDILKKNPGIRTGDLHKKHEDNKEVWFMLLALYSVEEELLQTGEIIAEKHGPGKHRTWSLPEK